MVYLVSKSFFDRKYFPEYMAAGRSVAGFMSRRFNAPFVPDHAAATTCIQHEAVVDGRKVEIADACRVRDGVIAAWMTSKEQAPGKQFNYFGLSALKENWNDAYAPRALHVGSIDIDQEEMLKRITRAYPCEMIPEFYNPAIDMISRRSTFIADLVEKVAAMARESGTSATRKVETMVERTFSGHEVKDIIKDFKGTREPAIARQLAKGAFWSYGNRWSFGKSMKRGTWKSTIQTLKDIGNPAVTDAAFDLVVKGGRSIPKSYWSSAGSQQNALRLLVTAGLPSTGAGMHRAMEALEKNKIP